MKNRIVYDEPFAEYLLNPAVSKSMLTTLDMSAGLYYARYISETAPKKAETDAQRIGRVTHTLILEPEKASQEIVILPELNLRLKDDRMEKEHIISTNPGKAIMKREELDKVLKMREKLMKNPDAADYIKAAGECEVSMYWQHHLGVACKGRADKILDDGLILDLKTARDACPAVFAKDASKYSYEVQDASYSYGFKKITGSNPKGFVFIVIENEEPHLSSVVRFDKDSRMSGLNKYNRLVKRLKECALENSWPKYSHTKGVEEIRIPEFRMEQDYEGDE